MNNDNDNAIKEAAQFYLQYKKPVHIKLDGGAFYNGKIKRIVSSGLILEEEKFGILYVLFSRIKDITLRIKKEVAGDGKN